jgi:hypothetical protein
MKEEVTGEGDSFMMRSLIVAVFIRRQFYDEKSHSCSLHKETVL